MTHADLIDALSMSQRLGFLGARPIAEVIEHALGFVDAISSLTGHVVDLGAGGGVPGLVLAAQRPDLALTMVDRRTKRTDFLERIVHKYDLGERVEVLGLDVDDLIESSGGTFDVAVARGFGPPLITLGAGTALVRVGGSIVISEPPDGDRWNADDLDRLGVERQPEASGVVRFVRLT